MIATQTYIQYVMKLKYKFLCGIHDYSRCTVFEYVLLQINRKIVYNMCADGSETRRNYVGSFRGVQYVHSKNVEVALE